MREPPLRDDRLDVEERLTFLGRHTAGQSHEVTNVLNVINELAGLLHDLVHLGEQRGRFDADRMRSLAERIQAQVHRGEQIVRKINRFAHATDHQESLFDARDALDVVAFIAGRPARLGRVALELDLPADPLHLVTSPLGFQQAVFEAIETALQAASTQRAVSVSARRVADAAEVRVRSADPLPPPARLAPRLEHLATLVTRLGGRVTVPDPADPPQGAHALCLTFSLATPKNGSAVSGDAQGRHSSER